MKFSARVKLSEQDLTISEKTTLVTPIPCHNLLFKKSLAKTVVTLLRANKGVVVLEIRVQSTY